MILVNLLPHREAARKRRRDIFNISLGASAVFGCLIAGAIYLWYEAAISEQQNTNVILQTEIKKLEKEGTSEDICKSAEEEVQNLTNAYIKKVDETLATKEAEIMKV